MTTMTDTRTWTVAIPAPTPMQTSNRREHWSKISRRRKTWRETAYGRIALAKLPRGLTKIRVDVELRFTTNRRRDAPNYYSDVIKPCIDALAPEKRVKLLNRPGHRVEMGWGVIPDDTAEFLDLTAPKIGPVVAKTLHPFGLVVLTITDLSEVPGA
ncbi:hypothetical protein MED01_002344 [Micromonospora sp. MED01]|uniref:hypothetical protein n=1 Tax=Micromonospora alfalfae TaxID=2911212 RepID=UPI001EE9545E|nr:hypothetical protein [Micromonospora alfalfae]MCG5464179.1 hypothetical protein [Micromonospora alfalfae]